MKKIYVLMAMFVVAIIGTLTTSCSESENDHVNAEYLSKILKQNKWSYRDVSYHEGSGTHAWSYDVRETLYFTSDDTGIAYIVTKESDTELGNSRYTDWYMFTYNVVGNMVVVTDESYNTTNYTYSDGKLINGTAIYESSELSVRDYEILESIGLKTGQCGYNLKYSIDSRNGIMTISGSGDMYNYDDGNVPWKNEEFFTLFVEEGCTSIGNDAFNGFFDLCEVSLCKSLLRIGDRAFQGTSIEKILMPDNLITIGDNAFDGCSYLKSVNLAGCDALKTIGNYAFLGSSVDFGYFTIPKNVESIGDLAFMTTKIKRLTLNDNLKTIGHNAFPQLSMSKLVIPNSVTSIGSGAFWGSFSEIRIGTGLKTITGTPFLSSSKGTMYVSTKQPAFLPEKGCFIIADLSMGENAVKNWNLHVPSGCKNNYESNSVWGQFKSIIEDSSL